MKRFFSCAGLIVSCAAATPVINRFVCDSVDGKQDALTRVPNSCDFGSGRLLSIALAWFVKNSE